MSTATWSKRLALGLAAAAIVAPAAQARVYDEPSTPSVPPATVAAPSSATDTATEDYKSSYPQLHSLTRTKATAGARAASAAEIARLGARTEAEGFLAITNYLRHRGAKQQRVLIPRSPYFPN